MNTIYQIVDRISNFNFLVFVAICYLCFAFCSVIVVDWQRCGAEQKKKNPIIISLLTLTALVLSSGATVKESISKLTYQYEFISPGLW